MGRYILFLSILKLFGMKSSEKRGKGIKDLEKKIKIKNEGGNIKLNGALYTPEKKDYE